MSKNLEKWSLADVSIWLQSIGLGKYADLFRFNEIDGAILNTMTENDVRQSPLTMYTFGDIRKFGINIEKLKSTGFSPMVIDRLNNSGTECLEDLKISPIKDLVNVQINSPFGTEGPIVKIAQTENQENEERLKLNISERITGNKLDILKQREEHEKEMRDLEAKAIKYAKGEYASDMEAFFDGAPGFDSLDSDDEDVKIKKAILKGAKHSPPTREPKWDDLFYKDNNGNAYVKVYPKQGKPPKGLNRVFFNTVVSATEIYVYIEEQRNFLPFLSEQMQNLHKSDHSYHLPERFTKIGHACAVLNDDDLWCRGRIISEPNDNLVEVLLVDYNKTKTVSIESLKGLRSDSVLKYELQIFKGQVTNIELKSEAELQLFRKFLLDEKIQFHCYFNTRAKEPWPMNVHMVDGSAVRSFVEFYEEKKNELEI